VTRRALVLLGLIAVASVIAFVAYMGLFGIAFAINGTYFPETRDYHRMFAPLIIAVTWVASFSTTSLAYVLYRNRKDNK
jgi:uncharacterized membrane protein